MKKLVRRLCALAVAAVVAVPLVGCHGGAHISVTSPDDSLQLSKRLVFSTARVNGVPEPVPPKALTVSNTGNGPLSVTGLPITGPQASSFALASGQPTSFTVPQGEARDIAVQFVPTGNLVVRGATLTIENNSDQGSYAVALRGLNANGFEGGNEPRLQTIFSALGYGTSAGGTTLPLNTTRQPIGDEIISPFFRRANAAAPVQFIPVARYIQRYPPDDGVSGWFTRSGEKNGLYTFPGDELSAFGGENQKLVPGITPGDTMSFSPPGAFGVYLGSNLSDDGRNGKVCMEVPVDPPTQDHNFRFYRARTSTGVVIPNTWLAGLDVKPKCDKNYDYQDMVYLLVNATPEIASASTPGPATSLEFSSAAGGLNDKDGEGTGFTSVQPNGGGDASLPANVDLDTAQSRLRMTSTAGTNTNTQNTQQNALQVTFDSTRQAFRVHARLIGPFGDLNAGNEQEAVYFGPNQDNYFKLEVENFNGAPHLSAVIESTGENLAFVTPSIPLPSGGNIATLDLFITGDSPLTTIQASYSVNDGAVEVFGPAVMPPDLPSWFSTQAKAGILVSNRNSTNGGVIGIYDRFSVDNI